MQPIESAVHLNTTSLDIAYVRNATQLDTHELTDSTPYVNVAQVNIASSSNQNHNALTYINISEAQAGLSQNKHRREGEVDQTRDVVYTDVLALKKTKHQRNSDTGKKQGAAKHKTRHLETDDTQNGSRGREAELDNRRNCNLLSSERPRHYKFSRTLREGTENNVGQVDNSNNHTSNYNDQDQNDIATSNEKIYSSVWSRMKIEFV